MLRNDGDTDNAVAIEKNNNDSKHLKIDNLMTDNAVFQHGVSNIVTGYAKPNAFVQVDFNGGIFSVIASDSGRFTVRIPSMAPAENLELIVTSGEEKCVFANIAVGNVYICAGQSNMGFKLANCVPGPESLADKDYEGIHYFKIPVRTYYGKQDRLPGNWIISDKNTAPDFSGIAYFFARKLYQKTKIPVGIIDASIGGVNIEAWLSRKSLFKIPAYRKEMLEYEKIVSVRDTAFKDKMLTLGKKLDMKINELFPEDPEDYGEKNGFFKAGFDDADWDEMYCPDSWTQAGHNHAGIFWFRKDIDLPQGAENLAFELSVGAIDKADKTYVNGKLVGTTGIMRDMATWNKIRVYDVERGIFKSGRNNIAIQVSSLLSVCSDGGLIGPAKNMFLRSKDGSVNIPLAGSWKFKETFDAGIEGMTCMRAFGQGGADSFHIFYDNLIYPLSGISVNGVIWYQGEANSICMAHTYHELLNGMIADFRDVFENENLHFYIVQLPEFNTEHYFAPCSQWSRIREAQLQSSLDTDSDCIVTLGYGDELEIHPPDKKVISDMIAQKEYCRINFSAIPQTVVLQSLKAEKNALILKFSGDEISPVLSGFAISSKDMTVFKADAELIDGHTLKVYSSQVAEPYAVWYAWADNPSEHSFETVSGEKVSPFRAALDTNEPVGRNII